MKAFLLSALLLTATAFAEAPQPAAPAMTDAQMKFYADAATKSAQAAERARQQAKSAVDMYVQAAEMRCRQKLASSQDYVTATGHVAAAEKALDTARTLHDTQQQVIASSQLNVATAQVKKLEAAAMAGDVDASAAHALSVKLDPPAPAVAVATAARQEPRKKYTSIEVGMTHDELTSLITTNPRRFTMMGSTVTVSGGACHTAGGPVTPTSKSELLSVQVLSGHSSAPLVHNYADGHRTVEVRPETGPVVKVTLIDDVVTEVFTGA